MLAHATIHVVLADDHCALRRGLRGFLTEDSLIEVVAEAEDGDQALEAIERFCPEVAIVDLQMSHLTGIEVTRWVRERHYPVGVLILTAYDDEPYMIAALEAGANGYVLKYGDLEEIVRAVHIVASGGYVLDRKIKSATASLLSP
jgi:DNA-binding NarL/FixJ family response regulator